MSVVRFRIATAVCLCLCACAGHRDAPVADIAPASVVVPAMSLDRVDAPAVYERPVFRLMSQGAPGVPGPAVPNLGPLPAALPHVAPVPSPTPHVTVVGIAEGRHPTAALDGWRTGFVTIGDALLDATVVKISSRGVRLSNGRWLAVQSAAAAAAAGPNMTYVVPDISAGPPEAAPFPAPGLPGPGPLVPAIPTGSAPVTGAAPFGTVAPASDSAAAATGSQLPALPPIGLPSPASAPTFPVH